MSSFSASDKAALAEAIKFLTGANAYETPFPDDLALRLAKIAASTGFSTPGAFLEAVKLNPLSTLLNWLEDSAGNGGGPVPVPFPIISDTGPMDLFVGHASTLAGNIVFPNLISDAGDLGLIFSNCNGVTSFTFPSLIATLADFTLSNNTGLVLVNAPLLASIGGNLSVQNHLGLSGVSIPAITGIGGYLAISQNPDLGVVDFPVLDSIGNALGINDCGTLVTINLSSLATVGTDVSVSFDPSLVSLSLPLLVSVGGIWNSVSNAALMSLHVPSLVTVLGNWDSSVCAQLSTVDVSSWVPMDGTSISFNGDALSAASVELILHRCILASVTTCTINLSGGTNAALSALSLQGQADYAALVLAGNTMSINP